MAEQNIGAAAISILVDTDQLYAEISRAKSLVASMGPEFERNFAKMTASKKRATQAALKLAQQTGKTREEIKLLGLGARGAAPQALEKLRQKMLQTGSAANMADGALGRNSKAFSGNAKSARELQFAMRGLPAQLTDIFTSLASGQNPSMVALQQGGQLKDMFGGIKPAARALGGALLKLVNPYVLVGGAAAALGVAMYKGAQEFNAYNVALAKTGDFAGYTAAELGEMAEAMDGLEGVTESDAAAALAQVAASGKLIGENLELATKAALVWSETTGESVDAVIDKFVEIGKDPVDALLELNKTEHFLTRTQLERIRVLEEEGRTQEAIAEAARIYSETVISRAKEVEENLGYLESAWHTVKDIASETWDAMRGVGRKKTRSADSVQKEIDDLGKLTYESWRAAQLQFRQGSLDPKEMMLLPPLDQSAFDDYVAQQKKALQAAYFATDDWLTIYDGSEPVVKTADEKARIKYLEATEADRVNALSEQARLAKEIADAKALGLELDMTGAQIEARVAGIKAKSAETESTSSRRRAQSTRDQITDAERLVASARKKIAAQERSIALFGETAKAAQVAYDVQASGLDKINPKLAEKRVEATKWLDWLQEMADVSAITEDIVSEQMGAMKSNTEQATTEMSRFADEAGRNMQDAFANFLFDPFKDGLDGMLGGFDKILQRMHAKFFASQIFKALAEWGNNNSGKDGWVGVLAGLAGEFFGSSSGPDKNALGGVYDSPSLSKYSGGVYNTPQLFAFAKGAGVFGEAGPEAIMPLSRGPNGKLGVESHGGGDVEVEINITNQGEPVQARQTGQRRNGGKVMIDMVIDAVAGDVAKGGRTAQAMQGRFGLQRRGVPVGA